MNEKNRNRTFGMGTFAGLARAALAALAIATLAATPHAEAQRRPAAAAQASTERVSSAPAQAASGVVNIQTATVEELQRLPGVGPSKAAAIVAFRDRTPFRRIEDIVRVRGIGRATFRRLRPMLTVSGPTTLAQDVRAPRRAASSGEDGSGGGDADAAAED